MMILAGDLACDTYYCIFDSLAGFRILYNTDLIKVGLVQASSEFKFINVKVERKFSDVFGFISLGCLPSSETMRPPSAPEVFVS